MPSNILGYALIQLPDLVLVVYRYLKKVIRKGNISISDVPSGTEQNDVELASVSCPEDNFYTSDRAIQRFYEISQRMGKTDERLNRIEELMSTV